ncbi:MAG: hypothetical protein GTN78_14315 [Gemmatimonadales bacterium]|nr:hypothetical protein [Gemmatimonadales bacterium]
MIWCVWTFSVNPMGPWFDEFPLLSNVIVILLGFAGLNALCRRFRPDWAFSQTELLLLYTVLTVSTAVGASFYGQGLAILLAHPMWFGQPGALYEWSAFPQHLPSWLVVSDLEALSGFWQGGSTLYSRVALRAWAVPVLAWTGFITVLVFLTMCLNVLLRRTWVNSEHLTFPIVLLPMEMTRPSGELFRSRLMWVAFALAFGTQLVNGIAYLYPGLPTIPTAPTSIGNLFPDPPWNAMSGLMICFHPLMIGLGCLLPMDILFSQLVPVLRLGGGTGAERGGGLHPSPAGVRLPVHP